MDRPGLIINGVGKTLQSLAIQRFWGRIVAFADRNPPGSADLTRITPGVPASEPLT
jgi:hypothetical protein